MAGRWDVILTARCFSWAQKALPGERKKREGRHGKMVVFYYLIVMHVSRRYVAIPGHAAVVTDTCDRRREIACLASALGPLA